MIGMGGVSGCLVRQPGLHVRDTLRPGLGMLKPPAQGVILHVKAEAGMRSVWPDRVDCRCTGVVAVTRRSVNCWRA